jgi:hypothetical protein
MVDKVKPLKLESPSLGGTEADPFPTEVDPAEDYITSKGLSFENSDVYLAEKLGDVLSFKKPDFSQKVTYNVNGTINFVEWFIGATQTTPNRRAKSTLVYGSNLFPITETLVIYSTSDGTTVLRTITLTGTYTGADLSSASEATT